MLSERQWVAFHDPAGGTPRLMRGQGTRRLGAYTRRTRKLKQRRPPAAPSLLAAHEMSRDVPPAGPRKAAEPLSSRLWWGLCALEGSFRRGFAQCSEDAGGPCALGGPFQRGFARWLPVSVYKVPSQRGPQCTQPAASRSPVYKPSSKRGRQCTKPAASRNPVHKPSSKRGRQCTKPGRAHWRGRSGGSLYSARRMRAGCAHWEACSGGGLRSARQPQCTKPRRNVAASVHSRRRRETQCTNPSPNRVASAQSRTVRTPSYVRLGSTRSPVAISTPMTTSSRPHTRLMTS